MSSLRENIADGKYDQHLDAIITACIQRKEEISYQLVPGDRVRFSSRGRPQYLRGQIGTVRGWSRSRVVIDLDQPAGRFFRGIKCPPSLLTKVEKS